MAPDDDADGLGAGDEESVTGLTGRVLTESLDPSRAARVVVVRDDEVQAEATTDESGYYRILLEPGAYRIQVNSVCCKEVVRAVKVDAGQMLDVNFMLEFLTADDLGEPHVVQGDWTGMLSCSVRVPGVGGLNLNCSELDPNQDWNRDIVVKEGLRTIVMAMEWDSSVSNLMDTMVLRHDKGNVGGGSGNSFFRVDDVSPIEVVVGPEDALGGEHLYFDEIEDSWETEIGVWAGGGEHSSLNVVYQQSFTVYWRLYYWEEAPAGVSALPS